MDKDKLNRCVELLLRTYTQLGQSPDEDTVMSMALLLCEDLSSKYKSMSWEAVELAFDTGISESDLFHIQRQTWNKWLRYTRQQIWNGYFDMKSGSSYRVPKNLQTIINNQKLLK